MPKVDGKVFLDQAKLRKALTGSSGDVTRLVARTTRNVLNAAKIGAPVDTGLLRMKHRSSGPVVSGLSVAQEVVADTDYALYVHEGHGVIRPVKAKFLRFEVKGAGGGKEVVFAKSTRAQPPRPWLKNALKQEAGREGFSTQ